MKPSVCAYTSLFAITYLQSHIVKEGQQADADKGLLSVDLLARDYCFGLQDSIVKKLGLINQLLQLDIQQT